MIHNTQNQSPCLIQSSYLFPKKEKNISDTIKTNVNNSDKSDNLPSFSCWLLSGYSDDDKLIHICHDNIDDILQYLGFNQHHITTIKLLIIQQVNNDNRYIDFKLSTWKNDICYGHYFSTEF